MSVTFTIGSSTFADLDTTNGRKALAINPENREQELKRFHLPGVDGNFIVRGGAKSRRITMRMRYIGADVSTAVGYYTADSTSWEAAAVDITGDGGESYTSCNLQSLRRISDIQPTGITSGQVYFDAEAVFLEDG